MFPYQNIQSPTEHPFEPLSEIIDRILLEDESKYIETLQKKILIFSWNLASGDPVDSIRAFFAKLGRTDPDFIILGFQEVDMKVSSIVMGDWVDRTDLEDRIYQVVPDNNKYKFISKHYGGVSLLVFLKTELSNQVKSSEFSVIPLGKFNMANKCAILASIIIGISSICFICAHFPAAPFDVNIRNEAYNCVLANASVLHNNTEYFLPDHKIIFFFGDLNYRIDIASTPDMYSEKYSLIYNNIAKFDQLYSQRLIGRVFKNFNEAEIMFPPTYKLGMGDCATYYDSKRIPAWTDRILYNSSIEDSVEIFKYESFQSPQLISDHHPVYATIGVKLDLINQKLYSELYNKASIKAASLIMSSEPKIKLSFQFFNFNDIHYYKRKTQTLIVKNIGVYEVSIRISEHVPTIGTLIKWLLFANGIYNIKPNQELEIKFEAFINEEVNKSTILTSDQLSKIIIINVRDGSDYFITFDAKYIRGCCGYPLTELVNKPFPLKSTLLEVDFSSSVNVPLQLCNLINFINLDEENQLGLFENYVVNDEVLKIIDMLDYEKNCEIHSSTSVIDVANALLFFLKSLPEKIISMNSFNNNPIGDDIFNCLSHPYYSVFRFILLFLTNISKNPKNKTNILNLSRLFSTILINEDIFLNPTNPLTKKYPSGFTFLMAMLRQII